MRKISPVGIDGRRSPGPAHFLRDCLRVNDETCLLFLDISGLVVLRSAAFGPSRCQDWTSLDTNEPEHVWVAVHEFMPILPMDLASPSGE